MSIEKKANGQHLARWRETSGRQRARSFGRKVDAESPVAAAEIKRRATVDEIDAAREGGQ